MSPKRFVPGQNAPLATTAWAFTASGTAPLELSALVVDYEMRALSSDDFVYSNHPETLGVRLTAGEIAIDLGAVHPAARAVLCIASAATAVARLVARLRAPDGAELTAEIDCRAGESTVICWELYRRPDGWKVRAVGQGHAGGIAELLPRHGLEAKPAPPSATPPQAIGMERLGMILEDGARSACSYVMSTDYAATQLDDELSAAVADPATRTGPQADLVRAQAQQRHDDLIRQARDRYDQDSGQLITELQEVERTLPRALADWTSPAWATAMADEAADGFRIGTVAAPERGPLCLPLCFALPLRRALWIAGVDSRAHADVVLAIALRMLAANPATTVEVVDLTGSLAALTGVVSARADNSVITEIDGLAHYLAELPGRLELEMLKRAEGMSGPVARLLVFNHFPFGYDSRHLALIARLAEHGVGIGVSLVLAGEQPSPDDFAIHALAEKCTLVPATGGARWSDPWTSTDWTFEVDSVPADPAHRSRILTHFAGGTA